MSNTQLPLSAEQKEALANYVAKLCSDCVRISGLLGQKQQRGYLDIEAGFELVTTTSTLCLGVAKARKSTVEGALNWLNWHLERLNAVRVFAGMDALPNYTCLEMPPAVGAAFKGNDKL